MQVVDDVIASYHSIKLFTFLIQEEESRVEVHPILRDEVGMIFLTLDKEVLEEMVIDGGDVSLDPPTRWAALLGEEQSAKSR